MQRTRREILNILKVHGPATIEALARELGLVPVTVRSHLSVLERDGHVKSEEVRGKVGRPHFLYSLTREADQLFPQGYARVADRLISCLREIVDPDLFRTLGRKIGECWAKENAGRVSGASLEERVKAAAAIRTDEGALATWTRTNGSFLLTQHHCPCRELAEHHRLVCQAEHEYLRLLLGADVERVEYQMEGAPHCSYRIHPQSD